MPLLVGWCPGCDAVDVAGSTDPGHLPQMGTFTRMSGVTRSGRPVYKHANKGYLFYRGDKKWWMIGPNYTNFIGTFYAQTSDALEAHLVPAGNWLEHKGGGVWQANAAFTVVCTPGMHLAAAAARPQTCLCAHRPPPWSPVATPHALASW